MLSSTAALVLLLATAAAGQHNLLDLVRTAAWGDDAAQRTAMQKVRDIECTRDEFTSAERLLRRGRSYAEVDGERQTFTVPIPGQNSDDKRLPVLVLLPEDYNPGKAYPLMVAMGGGPLPSVARAKRQGAMMGGLWRRPARKAGWFVAAISDTVSIVQKRRPLRYPILRDTHFKAVVDAVAHRYHIDPNRVHATGVSLGSNYSVAYAAAHPDWFAGVVPVSTEGESREWVLRNLNRVGVFVLEGVNDRNIRGISGPRRMKQILKALEVPHVYVEDPRRGHEAFQRHYPRVLEWLGERPRMPFPETIVRIPHPGILMPGKRFFWLSADTHQAAFHAVVDRKSNRISVHATRARTLTFYLADQLLDLDAPITIRINGADVFEGRVQRSLTLALADLRHLADPQRFATARVTVPVPNLPVGDTWLATLKPKVEPARLAFWEMYAMDMLKDAARALPARLEPVSGTDELRVVSTDEGCLLPKGDVVLKVDDEPMFGASSLAFLRSYLIRRSPRTVTCTVRRAGKSKRFRIELGERR